MWSCCVRQLADVAVSQPQAACAAWLDLYSCNAPISRD